MAEEEIGGSRWFLRHRFGGMVPVTAVLLALVALAGLSLAGSVLYLRHERHQERVAADESRERAEAVAARRTEDLAAAVAAVELAGLTEQRLDQLASEHDAWVRQINREPPGEVALVLVVETRAGYLGRFGSTLEVRACHELTFTSAGDADAGWAVTALESCPPAQREPVRTPPS